MKQYDLPEYVLLFAEDQKSKKDEDLIASSNLLNKLEITTESDIKLFELICQAAKTSYDRKKTASFYFNDFFGVLLKNLNKYSDIKNFPKTEETLRNNLMPLLNKLSSKGFCELTEEYRNNTRDFLVGLLPGQEAILAEKEKEKNEIINKIIEYYNTVKNDNEYPLPTKKVLEQQFTEEKINQLNPIFMDIKQFNRSEIDKYKENNKIVYIKIGIDYYVVILTDMLNELYNICVNRVKIFFENLLAPSPAYVGYAENLIKTIDIFLSKNFPEDTHLNFKYLINSLGNNHNEYKSGFNIWAALFQYLATNVLNKEKPTPKNISLIQACLLLYGWFSYERDKEREKIIIQKLQEQLKKFIMSYKRPIYKKELYSKDFIKNFIKNFSEEKFEEVLNDFLKTSSFEEVLKQEQEITQSIIILSNEKEGEYYIYSDYILDIFEETINQLNDKEFGIKRKEFIVPWSFKLNSNAYDEETALIMSSDEYFSRYLLSILKNKYTLFYDLYFYFLNHNDILSYLCKLKNIPLKKYFESDEITLKPITTLLDISRIELIKKAKKSLPTFRKFLLWLINLFSRKTGDKETLWNVVEKELGEKKSTYTLKKDKISSATTYSSQKSTAQTKSSTQTKPTTTSSTTQKQYSETIKRIKPILDELEESLSDHNLEKWNHFINEKDAIENKKRVLEVLRKYFFKSLNIKDLATLKTVRDFYDLANMIASKYIYTNSYIVVRDKISFSHFVVSEMVKHLKNLTNQKK